MKVQTSSRLTLIVSLMLAFVFASITIPVYAAGDLRKNMLMKTACELKEKAEPPKHDLMLWYRQPAREWREALPIGNGRLGAMVYGGVNKAILQVNEDTIWSYALSAINRERSVLR